MKTTVTKMLSVVLMAVACAATGAQIDLNATGVTVYGHDYDGYGAPRSFTDADTYTSAKVTFSADYQGGLWVNAGTINSDPGYAVYKFVAPANSTITAFDLAVTHYHEAGLTNVYYRTTEFSGTPSFGDWADLGSLHNGSKNFTFTPQSGVVYLAYAGINPGATWQNQVQADKLSITTSTIPEPASLGLLALGSLFLRRRRG